MLYREGLKMISKKKNKQYDAAFVHKWLLQNSLYISCKYLVLSFHPQGPAVPSVTWDPTHRYDFRVLEYQHSKLITSYYII